MFTSAYNAKWNDNPGGKIYSLNFNQDNKTLVAGNDNQKIYVYTYNGAAKSSITINIGEKVYGVAVSKDSY